MTAEDIVYKLQDSGFEAYLVGGCVRDMLLGLEPKDKDIATSASHEEIRKIFSCEQIKTLGKSFLVTFINNIEVATFRTDNYKGLNDKNVEIHSVKTAREDSLRRDFTINALFFNPRTKEVIDYVNGQDDLKNRIIRFVGNPTDRIWEDPNRIIRACRFLAKINGSFDQLTFEILKKYSDYVQTLIAPERIRLEILKAMDIKKSSLFFRALYDIDALKYIFPTLNKCYNLDGGPYHIEPVFDHCVGAGDHVMTKYPLIKLASYLHDIGKGISCRINPRTSDIWFEGHEETGSEASKKELGNLKFSNEEINYISTLIKLHMRISHERLSPKGVRRTLQVLRENNISYHDLLRVSISDKMGGYKSSKNYNIGNVYQLLKSFRDEVNRKNSVCIFSDLNVDGNDVMKITGLKPGKKVGEILKYLLNLVLDNPELNEKEILIKIIMEHKEDESSIQSSL